MYDLLKSLISKIIIEFLSSQVSNPLNSYLFKRIIKALIIMYENNNPYKNPKILSIIIPNICLSKSALKNFLILFKINKEIKKIKGIPMIIDIMPVKYS